MTRRTLFAKIAATIAAAAAPYMEALLPRVRHPGRGREHWVNYTSRYTGISKEEFIRRARLAMKSTIYKPLVEKL